MRAWINGLRLADGHADGIHIIYTSSTITVEQLVLLMLLAGYSPTSLVRRYEGVETRSLPCRTTKKDDKDRDKGGGAAGAATLVSDEATPSAPHGGTAESALHGSSRPITAPIAGSSAAAAAAAATTETKVKSISPDAYRELDESAQEDWLEPTKTKHASHEVRYAGMLNDETPTPWTHPILDGKRDVIRVTVSGPVWSPVCLDSLVRVRGVFVHMALSEGGVTTVSSRDIVFPCPSAPGTPMDPRAAAAALAAANPVKAAFDALPVPKGLEMTAERLRESLQRRPLQPILLGLCPQCRLRQPEFVRSRPTPEVRCTVCAAEASGAEAGWHSLADALSDRRVDPAVHALIFPPGPPRAMRRPHGYSRSSPTLDGATGASPPAAGRQTPPRCGRPLCRHGCPGPPAGRDCCCGCCCQRCGRLCRHGFPGPPAALDCSCGFCCQRSSGNPQGSRGDEDGNWVAGQQAQGSPGRCPCHARGRSPRRPRAFPHQWAHCHLRPALAPVACRGGFRWRGQ